MGKSAQAFRTIREVADWLGVQAHVLRFWESKFSQIRPVKRAGGRRYYRPADMALVGGIKTLLHDDGLTIRGVQKLIREQGVAHVAAFAPPIDDLADPIEGAADGPAAVGAAATGGAQVIDLPRPRAPAQAELSFAPIAGGGTRAETGPGRGAAHTSQDAAGCGARPPWRRGRRCRDGVRKWGWPCWR